MTLALVHPHQKGIHHQGRGERLPARTNPLGGDCGGDFSGDDINQSSSCSVTRVFSAAAFFLHGLLAYGHTCQ